MYGSNFFNTMVLNTFNGVTAVGAGGLFCGLFISNPGKTGVAGNEVQGAWDTRQQINFGAPYETELTMNIANQNDLLWNTATSDAGTARFIGIFDSAVPGSGNMWLYGELAVHLDIKANQQPSVYAGEVMYMASGNFTRVFQTRMLNLLRGQNINGFTPYWALFDGDPEETGGELTGGGYVRPEISFNAPTQQAGGQMMISNTSDLRFPSPTTPWGLWAWDGIRNAQTGGDIVLKTQNMVPEILQKNYVPIVYAGEYRTALN